MPNIIIDKWKLVDPNKEPYLGYEFEKDGKRVLQKRCDYCGKWITFDIRGVESWGDNVKMGFNGYPEKIHCGSLLCQDYHHRVLLQEKRDQEKWARRGERIFLDLKKAGVIG